MPIITNATFHKLTSNSISKLNSDIVFDFVFFLENVINNKTIFYVFNKIERKKLFIAKSILEDEKNFIEKYYNKLEIRIDDFKSVYSRGGKYKYHYYEDCKSINNDFFDFTIPSELYELGEEVVTFFRKWFDEMGFKEWYMKIRELQKIEENVNMLFSRIRVDDLDRLNFAIVRGYNKTFPSKY